MELSEPALREKLDARRNAYFNDVTEEGNDAYDALVAYYEKTFDKKYRQVGATCASDLRRKVKLSYYMGSVKTKVKGDDCSSALAKYIAKCPGPWTVSGKLDGMAGQYNVKNGRTVMYSRGDGKEGRDISSILDYIDLPVPDEAQVVRGELILPKSKFAEFAEREKARGSKNNWTCARSAVNSFFNRISSVDPQMASDMHYVTFQTQSSSFPTLDDYERLQELGFKIPRYWVLDELSEEILETLLKELQEDDYEYDGLVISPAYEAYPFPVDADPKHMIAFKLDVSAVTTVEYIEWNASAKGNLTPIIHYEKVVLCHTNCTNAKGHNAKFILDRQIGPGSKIVVSMGGNIIPSIIECLTPCETFQYPDCAYEWDETETNFRVDGFNDGVEISFLVHFANKLGIEGLKKGKAIILYQNGIQTVYDLCSLNVDTLKQFPSFALKSAKKLVDGIQAAITDANLVNLMAASNCFGIGFAEKKFQKIVDVYPNILDYAYNPSLADRITQIDGFDKTASVFAERLPLFVEWLEDHPQITIAEPIVEEVEELEQTFEGENIVFTGFTDKVMTAEIESRGGRFSSTSSGKTTIVVAKDPSKQTNSIKKAVNARILSLAEFKAEYFS